MDEQKKKEKKRSCLLTDMGIPGRTGPNAAAESFADVCGRCVTVNEMVSNPKLLTMMGLPQVDYGSNITAKAQAVVDIISRGN